ncbi:hypothetical protein DD238_002440 [Peronospora effusa]|uniref:PDZ domain-containing protein n=1 Tax=Peronospora effusa TaxID=542832 RepID=A0A3M6VTK5_9STRA|nr:hypothetical protein DD238_002440 [Peronospora effusa]
MVDAKVQTESSLPATVIGLEQDVLIGKRICKSFGSRNFWGSIIGCYWISGGLFYKVSFDDGDVDIFSSDEVLQDAAVAKEHAKETLEKDPSINTKTAVDDYFMTMRYYNLKRKRDNVVDITALHTRRIHLWGQKLYATIYTNTQNETFIREMLKTEDGKMGEMEATGQVKVGDMILAVNEIRVLGMTSKKLAELIRELKRPIALTFYRPQNSRMAMQLQQEQARQTQARQTQALASSSALTTTVQTQPIQQHSTQPIQQNPTQPQFVPSAQHVATISQQRARVSASALAPSSLGVARPTLAHPSLMAQNIADQWIKMSNMSRTHGLSTEEIVKRRLSQKIAARQANFKPGYPTGRFDNGNVVSVGGVPPTQSSMYPPHQVQIMQSVANAAAVSSASGFTMPAIHHARPTHLSPGSQFQYNQKPSPRQHTGPLTSEQVQQTKAVSGPSGHISEQIQSSASAEPSAGANKSSVVSQVESKQRVTSLQPERVRQEALTTSRHSSSQELASDQNFAVSTPRGSLTSTSSAPPISMNMLTTRDAEAVAKLAQTNQNAAEQAMSRSTSIASLLSPNHAANEERQRNQPVHLPATTSFLPTSTLGDKDQVKTKRKTTDSMSFLSPNDFNTEFSMLSHQNLSTGTAGNNRAEVKSNVSLVTVSVSRRRLYLTLGVQGSFIAVTSFVVDEFGRPGEVEASGKVFLGDVLLRINETFISAIWTPSHVADIVNRTPRPMTLWFKRASWDILNGKA